MSNSRYCIVCGREFQTNDPDEVLCLEHGGSQEAGMKIDREHFTQQPADRQNDLIEDPKIVSRNRSVLTPSPEWLAIYNMKVARDVDGLILALCTSEDVEMRRLAAFALGTLGDHRANFYLRQALEDPDDLVKWHASCALARLGDFQVMLQFLGDERPPFMPGMQMLKFDPWEWIRPQGRAAVQTVLQELENPLNFKFLQIGADFIIQYKDHGLVPVLWNLLGHEDYRIRAVAAHKLGALPEDQSCERLVPLLGDEVGVVADRAADALRMIGKPALPALRKVKDKSIRERAKELIKQIEAAQG